MAAKQNGGWARWLIILLIAGGVMAAGVWYYQRGKSDAPQYQTATVGRGEIAQIVTATGTLNPVVKVTVGSQVSGRISKLYVDFNSAVKEGMVIAELDPANYQATVEQITADLANAQANLELQQVQFQRGSELFTNKLISGSDYDIAEATLHGAEATVKIKQATLNNAKVNLGYCKIHSPVDGVVISRAVELGQTVASSFNTPTLFEIANDLTKMQINANVAEADIGGILEGQAVDFTVDAYPYRTFHGAVKQVRNSPTTLNNVVTYDAIISVTNADYKLKPGMTASVSIIVAQRPEALKIPNAAIRFRPPEKAVVLTNAVASGQTQTNQPAGGGSRGRGNRNARSVYLLAGSEGAPQLKQVPIKTGITDGIFTEVTDGLQAEDKVVTGVIASESQNPAQAANPFGSGFQRR